jgi:hypothetical protein
MDDRVWMVRVGIVPMLLWQSRRKRETRHEPHNSDRRASRPNHIVIMVTGESCVKPVPVGLRPLIQLDLRSGDSRWHRVSS